MKKLFLTNFLLLGLGSLQPLLAAVTLSKIFSDNMVLQRDFNTPIWGTAGNGESVTVKIAGQTKSATADASGNWMVKLNPIKAGGPHTLEVSGSNTITLTNILMGDVWLCSGQSNMAVTLTYVKNTYDSSVEASNVTDVRIVNNTNGWKEANPQTVMNFSATGFFFGRTLHRELGVPIGLIKAAVGGTNIEKWMSPASVEKDSLLDANTAILGSVPSTLYNSQIKPLIPMGLKGAVWYQGERNSKTDLSEDTRFEYANRMKLLIEGWRVAWGQGDFPFYSVQLPDFPNATYDLPNIREQQRLSMNTKNSGMIVTIDIGGDLHPQNKLDVGKRLANWALAHNYGKYDLVYTGPLYEKKIQRDDSLVLQFRHFGGDLKASGNGLEGFEIAGTNETYVPATAEIKGDNIIVYSSQVPNPVNARYAWSMEPVVSLVNKDGLPASPFTTEGRQLTEGLFGCRDSQSPKYNPNASIHDPVDCIVTDIVNQMDKTYPKIYLSNSEINIRHQGKYQLTIYNLSGKKIFSSNQWGHRTFTTHKFPSGIYFISFTSENFSEKVKLIIP